MQRRKPVHAGNQVERQQGLKYDTVERKVGGDSGGLVLGERGVSGR